MPIGTGSKFRSSTWSCVLASGRPIGMLVVPGATSAIRCHAAKVVVSVGPYPFTSRSGAPCASTSPAQRGSTASPPTSTSRTGTNAPGASRATWLNSVEVRNSEVILSSRSRASRSRDESDTSRGITTTVPPLSSAPQISKVAASNEQLAIWAIRSPAAKAHVVRVLHQPQDRTVLDGHALRPPGRARRVDDVRQVAPSRKVPERPLGPPRDHRPVRVHLHVTELPPERRQSIPQARLGQQHRHPRVLQHERQPFLRIIRVERHVHAPRLEGSPGTPPPGPAIVRGTPPPAPPAPRRATAGDGPAGSSADRAPRSSASPHPSAPPALRARAPPRP